VLDHFEDLCYDGLESGFALGPSRSLRAMSKLQSQSTSNTASMVQRASIQR